MGDRLQPALVLGIAAVVLIGLAHRDALRERASEGLGHGMPAREAELARGFVLGQDEGIDPTTVEDFRRSGLSHLLAVSGQNVVLLSLLAMPLLAAIGVPLRARLVWVLGLIALYVPLAGAGPSIQRAGVMGALGVMATLMGRRASRLYVLAFAAALTLAIDPGVAADVGWQLSFAAVLGIMLVATPLREALEARIGSRGWRRALAEGAAVTIAATLATAPLIAFHFGAFSTTTLLANLLALPAVAPAMWLGMVVAAGAQVPGFPAEALNLVNALLLGYIAQVAAWCGRPGWAYLHLRIGGAVLAASYLAMAAGALAAARLARRRRIAAMRRPSPFPPTGAGPVRGRFAVALGFALAALALVLLGHHGESSGRPPAAGLRVEVLDIGQGDAILLQPAHAPALLVDAGPAGEGLVSKLHAAGVDSLGAAILTHDQADHAGGMVELLGRLPVSRFLFARASRPLLARARAAGARPDRVAAGDVLHSGALRVEVLWPTPELLAGPLGAADPNQLALVLLARWRSFSILLTADAEAEAVPIDPGPVDVLKVAHHGSEDAGLAALLERTTPRLAVISVGAGNPYGHPAPATLATLLEHGVRTMRTDRSGTIAIEVRGGLVEVSAGG
ncbi:MAG TPA: ComEC/Rec2 family competence protein [Solirubrobacterales bacterium]|nr:ComEC/Rec2 family competence protein [Solirubrobacterales bacterium]